MLDALRAASAFPWLAMKTEVEVLRTDAGALRLAVVGVRPGAGASACVGHQSSDRGHRVVQVRQPHADVELLQLGHHGVQLGLPLPQCPEPLAVGRVHGHGHHPFTDRGKPLCRGPVGHLQHQQPAGSTRIRVRPAVQGVWLPQCHGRARHTGGVDHLSGEQRPPLGLDDAGTPHRLSQVGHRHQRDRRLRFGSAACGDGFTKYGEAQAAKSCPASRALPLGGG